MSRRWGARLFSAVLGWRSGGWPAASCSATRSACGVRSASGWWGGAVVGSCDTTSAHWLLLGEPPPTEGGVDKELSRAKGLGSLVELCGVAVVGSSVRANEHLAR